MDHASATPAAAAIAADSTATTAAAIAEEDSTATTVAAAGIAEDSTVTTVAPEGADCMANSAAASSCNNFGPISDDVAGVLAAASPSNLFTAQPVSNDTGGGPAAITAAGLEVEVEEEEEEDLDHAFLEKLLDSTQNHAAAEITPLSPNFSDYCDFSLVFSPLQTMDHHQDCGDHGQLISN